MGPLKVSPWLGARRTDQQIKESQIRADALALSAEEFLDEIRLNWENFDPEATVRRRLEGGGDSG